MHRVQAAAPQAQGHAGPGDSEAAVTDPAVSGAAAVLVRQAGVDRSSVGPCSMLNSITTATESM